jgi:hypothetical protein
MHVRPGSHGTGLPHPPAMHVICIVRGGGAVPPARPQGRDGTGSDARLRFGNQVDSNESSESVTGAAAVLSPRILRARVAGRGAPKPSLPLTLLRPLWQIAYAAGADRRLRRASGGPTSAEARFGVRAYPTPDCCPVISFLKPLSEATPGNRFGSVGACRSSASGSGLPRAKNLAKAALT